MALGDAYLTVAEFRARTKSVSTANDSAITSVLEAASRQIDSWTARPDGFNQSASITRYFTLPPSAWSTYRYGSWIHLGDVVSISALATADGAGLYTTAWASTDYDLFPLTPRTGWPYTEIRPAMLGSLSFPSLTRGVRVTGVFGWPTVPAPVKEATFLIANRMKSLWDAPFGQSGGGEMGSLDMTGSITPIIAAMLAPYRAVAV